jgi:HrpA-like RNA helicase
MPLPTLLQPGKLVNAPADEWNKRQPIDFVVNMIKQKLLINPTELSHRVIIVQSKTGSGKSTVMPVEAFRIFRPKDTSLAEPYFGYSVAVTEPRVITAINIVREDIITIPENSDMVLGKTIGYLTGARAFPTKKGGLMYMTLDSLLVQLQNMGDEDFMLRYRIIMIDEAHERSTSTDIILMKLKYFMKRNLGNPNLPILILTSATLDVEKCRNFYELPDENIISVEGSAYPVNIHWPKYNSTDFIRDSAALANQIHLDNLSDSIDKSDVLIFVPGGEATNIKKLLENFNRDYCQVDSKIMPFKIVSIQAKAVKNETVDYINACTDTSRLRVQTPEGKFIPVIRKIIISTAVAETGLTIPSLKYVIDNGWNREQLFYQPMIVGGIMNMPAAQSRITQRKGRSGRKFPGEFYPLYTEETFNQLQHTQYPAIITEGLGDYLSDIISEQYKDKLKRGQFPEFKVEDIDLLDKPPPDLISANLERAIVLGFVADNVIVDPSEPDRLGYGLTEFGQILTMASRIPMERLRIVLSSFTWNVYTLDMITIAACCGTPMKKIMSKPRSKQTEERNFELPVYTQVLKDAMPNFLSPKIGGGSDKLPTEQEKFYYASIFYISDDYIELLYYFDRFLKEVDTQKFNIPGLKKWCTDNWLSYNDLTEIMTTRQDIISSLLGAGINPFWGSEFKLADSNVCDYYTRISNIKHCLYDGFRLNILKYNPRLNKYFTRHGMEVSVPTKFAGPVGFKVRHLGIDRIKNPMYIVADKISLDIARVGRGEESKLIYTASVDKVSTITGFFDVDDEIFEPRESINYTCPDYAEYDANLDAEHILSAYYAAGSIIKNPSLLSQVPKHNLTFLMAKECQGTMIESI